MKRHAYSRYGKVQQGFSLIEVMIALVISMILLLALATLLMETNKSHRELSKQSRQIENGTYAMLKIGEEVKHAGFYGLYAVRGEPDPAVMPDPCTDVATPYTLGDNLDTDLLQAVKLPVQGYNDPAAAPIGCINNHLANTDILVIRRVNTNTNDIDVVDTTKTGLYLQSTAESVFIGPGNTFPTAFTLQVNTATPPSFVFTPPNAPTFEFFTHIYYIACDNCVAGGANIPTLYRASLDADGNFTNEPLADGIEQFQVEYGLDTTGNGAPDTWTDDPTDPGGDLPTTIRNWRQVVALRVYLLARNIEITTADAYIDEKTYDLGLFGTFTPNPNDPLKPHRYKRHLFTSTFQLMNLL